MNTKQLNDDCIRLIMKRLVLCHRIPLRAVCQQWKSVVEQTCLSVTTLKLFRSSDITNSHADDVRDYRLNDWPEFKIGGAERGTLVSAELFEDVEARRFVVTLLPQISSLVIRFEDSESTVFFLSEWRVTLKCLSLIDPTPESGTEDHLWRALNSLSLQKLHFFRCGPFLIPDNAPVLSQLEHLTLVFYTDQCVVPVLAQLGPNFKSLLLDWCPLSIDQLKLTLKQNPNLAKLQKLRLGRIENRPNLENSNSIVKLICNNFFGLQILDLSNLQINFSDIYAILCNNLPNLIELCVSAYQVIAGWYDRTSMDIYRTKQILSLLKFRIVDDELMRVLVVKFYRSIPSMFPKLECVTFDCFKPEQMDFIRRQVDSDGVGYRERQIEIYFNLWEDQK